MNGDLLLPLPRVQRHRQPAVVEPQRLPAGVKPGALGVVHGAGQQIVNVAIGVAAPDQMLALNGDPVQAKTPAVFRRVLAQRIHPPAAASLVKNKLRMAAHQTLQFVRVEVDKRVGIQRFTRLQQLNIAPQRGVEIFQMLCRLRIAHLQHRGQLQQRAFRFNGRAAHGGQAVRVDMQPAPDPARGVKLPGFAAHGDLPAVRVQGLGAQGALVFQLGEGLRHHLTVHFLPECVHRPTSLKKR